MKKSLEGLLEPERDNKHFLYGKVKKFVSEKLDYLRPYIASLGALSIGVANWSKDFAYSARVNIPFVYTNFFISGKMWYNLALLQEGATISALAATAKEKIKAAVYAVAYEAGSAINAYMYYIDSSNKFIAGNYGTLWNDVFFFYQVPILFLMLRKYFGKNKKTFDLDKQY